MSDSKDPFAELVKHAVPVTRRRILQAGLAASAMAVPGKTASSGPYAVGVGYGTDAYGTTHRALDAFGEWSAINFSGRGVVIKPNLVARALPQTGATTDAEVVRAIVDRAFASGAAFILIVEAGPFGANFDACGYSFFNTYDPAGRIRLIDLSTLPTSPINVNGWIYKSIYAHPAVLNHAFVFISVPKMKTHAESLVTLGLKNHFGLPDEYRYISSPPIGRFALHDRGLNQAILDVFMLRWPDLTVMDAVVAMEGSGPFAGTPVAMNAVLAGRNTLAVDRVALMAMGLSQNAVRYLNYASLAHFGPASLSSINILGDPLVPHTFALPSAIPPSFDPAIVTPGTFSPGSGQTVSIAVKYYENCNRSVQILSVSDQNTNTQLIRSLVPMSNRDAGTDLITWDGSTDAGPLATPGRYAVHVQAEHPNLSTRPSNATTWIVVQA